MRRLLITFLVLGTLVALPVAAAAADTDAAPKPQVDLIQVNGTLDPVMADFVHDALVDAGRHQSSLVIQLDSTLGVVPDATFERLLAEVRGMGLRLGVWVGPARAGRAYGQAAELLRAAAVFGVAPGAKVEGGIPAGANRAPTLGDFLVDAMRVPSKVITRDNRPPQRQPDVEIRFAKPPLVNRLLHAAANPSVPYVLFVSGALLMAFEFFAVGIGLATATGVLAWLLASYGLAVLPTRPGGLALLALGVFGLAVDVQVGAPRVWTVVGAASLVAGSLSLYAGPSVPIVTLVLMLAGTALFMGAAMPAIIRSRFSTPTIGRESMLGEAGVARSAVDPDGTVEVRGAPWRARTNRATPIAAGDRLTVVGIDGLVLEVEPESGGAKDYRH